MGFASALLFKMTGLKRAMPKYRVPAVFVPGDSLLDAKMLGFRISLRPADISIVVGTHEPEAACWFDPKPGQTVIDVGAHIGRYALMAAKKGAKVVAVEPNEANYAILQRNISINMFSNATARKVALSDSAGPRQLYLSGGENTGESSLETGWVKSPTGSQPRSTVINCTTLDALVKSLGISVIHWLKVDVEGHEAHMLEGAEKSLRVVTNLIIEVSSSNERRVLELLDVAGLRVRAVEALSVGEEGRISNWFCTRE